MSDYLELANGDFIRADLVDRIHEKDGEYLVNVDDHYNPKKLADNWQQIPIIPNHNPDLVAVLYGMSDEEPDGIYVYFTDIIAWKQEHTWLTPCNAQGLIHQSDLEEPVIVFNTRTGRWHGSDEVSGMTAESMLAHIYWITERLWEKLPVSEKQQGNG